MPTSSRHNGDTIDLLERGLAPAHQIQRDAADQPHAALLRERLELAHRGAIDDRLAQFIVENQQFTDGLSAAITAAPAMLAAAADREVVSRARRYRQLRLLEHLSGRHM